MFLGDTVKEMALPFLLRRVELRNYRSIEHCDVELGPLMFLVGPNGSGKSNFLDALRFVSDCLNTSVDQALRVRGGFGAVCRAQSTGTQRFSIELTLDFAGNVTATYFVEISAGSERMFEITKERCRFTDPVLAKPLQFERSRTGPPIYSMSLEIPRIQGLEGLRPSVDRLYLGSLNGWSAFRRVHQSLADMSFYNPLIAPMRDYQIQDPGSRLTPNASNMASVFRTMREAHPDWAERVYQYLSAAIPRLRKIEYVEVGERITLQFAEASIDGSERNFYASNMSDGTLRMLAILLALFQRSEQETSLVGIEEPEMGVHPAAAGVLFDSLSEASYFRQVLVTSHSSELLDRDEVDVDTLLAVSADNGTTMIGPINDRQKEVLRKRLGTAGELLRTNHLSPGQADLVSRT